jgi:hypothetical protein
LRIDQSIVVKDSKALKNRVEMGSRVFQDVWTGQLDDLGCTNDKTSVKWWKQVQRVHIRNVKLRNFRLQPSPCCQVEISHDQRSIISYDIDDIDTLNTGDHPALSK